MVSCHSLLPLLDVGLTVESTALLEVDEGGTAVLVCVARPSATGRLLQPCRAGTTYEWLRNGSRVASCPPETVDPRYQFDDQTGSLTMSTVSMWDDGAVFTCRVRNEGESEEKNTTLSVIPSTTIGSNIKHSCIHSITRFFSLRISLFVPNLTFTHH